MTAVLARSEILKLIHSKPPLIEGFIDLDQQLQPSGFDLTLREVRRFVSSGSLDFDNTRRTISHTQPIGFSGGKVWLDRGAYLAVFNEKVNIPKNIVAIAEPRSSLLRSGATTHTAVWDPGYSGRSRCLLAVFNPLGLVLYRNARILQLVFFKVLGEVGEGYSGRYQGEG